MPMIRRHFLRTAALPLLASSWTAAAWAQTGSPAAGADPVAGPRVRAASRVGAATGHAADAGPGTLMQDVWRDTDRQRDIPWRLRLPETGTGAASVPLILFSHGLGGSLDGGAEWSRAWAEAGFATLHLQHAGSDRAIWAGGLRAVKAAASVEQLVARCRDVRFAVARLLQLQQSGEAGWARIQPDALGMSGHSFGAHTTLAVAGRAFPARLGTDLAEPRFKAFAAFSPAAGSNPDGLRTITRPMLCMTGSLDGDPLGSERSGDYRREVYAHLPPGAKAQLWLEGADHQTFGGSGEVGAGRAARLAGRGRPEAPVALAEHHAAVIRGVTTDWWRAHLQHDAAAVQRLRTPQGLASGDAWQQG
jgi:predicted dienelactone hydrolase